MEAAPMLNDPQTWLVFAAVVAACGAGAIAGAMLGDEVREFFAIPDEPDQSAWGDVPEVPHDARRNSQ
jgi:hypothetical protein